MLWTCQKCQTQNPESSPYCQSCGERRVGNKSIKPNHYQVNSTTTTASQSKQRLTNAEQSFHRHLYPANFGTLEIYAAISNIGGFICYGLTVVTFLFAFMNDMGFWGSLISAVTPLIAGFSLQVISEMICLFLHGQQSWFLTSKYTYVNSELTNELLTKIDDLENKIQNLSNQENNSNC